MFKVDTAGQSLVVSRGVEVPKKIRIWPYDKRQRCLMTNIKDEYREKVAVICALMEKRTESRKLSVRNGYLILALDEGKQVNMAQYAYRAFIQELRRVKKATQERKPTNTGILFFMHTVDREIIAHKDLLLLQVSQETVRRLQGTLAT